MGREIRKVPEGWEHPQNEIGDYLPLYDQTYEDALKQWQEDRAEWYSDENAEERERVAKERACHSFEDWTDEAPDPAYHRSSFDGEAVCYQVYETVTEGTPTSPVFADLESLAAWLIEQGYSEHAAKTFAEKGWAPTMLMDPATRNAAMNINVFDWLPE